MRKLLWGRILSFAILAEILLLFSTALFLFASAYLDSYFEGPSPYVAIFGSLAILFILSSWSAILFLFSRWIGRKAPLNALAHALALWGVVVVLDTGAMVGMADAVPIRHIFPYLLIAHGAKLLGAWLGSPSVPV